MKGKGQFAMQSFVLYISAEVVCQGRHLVIAHTHHTDGWIPQFLKLPRVYATESTESTTSLSIWKIIPTLLPQEQG